jgi:hypothetical protein
LQCWSVLLGVAVVCCKVGGVTRMQVLPELLGVVCCKTKGVTHMQVLP